MSEVQWHCSLISKEVKNLFYIISEFFMISFCVISVTWVNEYISLTLGGKPLYQDHFQKLSIHVVKTNKQNQTKSKNKQTKQNRQPIWGHFPEEYYINSLSSCGSFLFYDCMPVGVGLVEVLFRHSCCWAFMDVASLTCLGDAIS